MATTKGKIAPFTPMEVPTSLRVVGIKSATNIMKGIERKKLISLSSSWKTGWLSSMPPFCVTIRMTPKNTPKPAENSAE